MMPRPSQAADMSNEIGIPGNLPGGPLPPDDGALAEFAEAVPYLLISMLERRYLAELPLSRWTLEAPEDDGARPLLREILALPRAERGQSQAMPHILSASHTLGQAVVTAIFGDGARHRFFVGGRRVPRGEISSTEDFLAGQASVLRAHMPGLELGQVARLDSRGLADLAGFLADAPALAAVTGIPCWRDAGPDSYQNLDRLTDAAAGHQYAVLIVAEPLDPTELDMAVDTCRRLKSEVHALVNYTVTEARAESTAKSVTTAQHADKGLGTWGKNLDVWLPQALTWLGVFCTVAGLIPSTKLLKPLADPVLKAAGLATSGTGQQDTVTSSRTETITRSGTMELLDANAQACEALLATHIERLEAARSGGWWRTAVYVAAETDGALAAVTAALRAICSGTTTALDPMRAIRIAPWALRPALIRGQTLTLRPAAGPVGHPLGATFDALATCMMTDELSVLLSLPQRAVAGLRIRDVGEFALSVPQPEPRSVCLGSLVDAHGRDLDQVRLSADEISRHVLITGMTGYGKTTTARQLLSRAHGQLGTPFLVIEPAKAEYRRLRHDQALSGELRVYSIGGDEAALPLRINPFRPVEGAPLGRHIDLLKSVFAVAFPMLAGLPAVLEEAMLDVYAERGWNLRTGRNDVLDERPAFDDVSALSPTLQDLRDQIEVVLARPAYAGEAYQNMGASLRSRLNSLSTGIKGDVFGSPRSVSAAELFGHPCVIELRDLADDEEKAFAIGLLLGMLYEHAESRQPDPEMSTESLQHITLIEEACRLLRAPRAAGAETGDAQAKAVTMFTDMMAEMGAYGEAFVVADQIPVKLAPEVLKNTNVKIIHRLAAADDRAAVAASMNLSEAQSRFLSVLPPGVAVVHDGTIGSAVLTRVPAAAAAVTNMAPPSRPDRRYLHRHGGCAHCPQPCTFVDITHRVGADDRIDAGLEPFFQALSLGDQDQMESSFADWRDQWLTELAALPADERQGSAYCAASQSGYRWISRVLGERAGTVSAAHGPAGAPARRIVDTDRGARYLARLIATLLLGGRPDHDDPAETAITRLNDILAAYGLPGKDEVAAR
jgi:Helicase HerA, central domain